MKVNASKPLGVPGGVFRLAAGMDGTARDRVEWDRSWSVLLSRYDGAPGDFGQRNESNGEAWQYLGTWNVGEGWVHEFRHRDHPGTGRREYQHVAAAAGWEPAEASLYSLPVRV